MECCDCELWKQAIENGACVYYLNNICPYGYYDKEEM